MINKIKKLTILFSVFIISCTHMVSMKDTTGKQFVIWAFSDIQPQIEKENIFFERAVDDVKKNIPNVNAAIIAGDIVQYGSEEKSTRDYKWFYGVYNKIDIPYTYEIAGNHDARNLKNYKKYVKKPMHYAVFFGNLLIIMMSDENESSGTDISDEVFFWWRDLVIDNQDKIIITVTHSHPKECGQPYSYQDDRNLLFSDRFMSILEYYKVEMWLYGHTHVPSSLGFSENVMDDYNGLVFVNISAIREDYSLFKSESRFIILEDGSDVITVKTRNHRDGVFFNRDFTVKARTAFKKKKTPKITAY